MDAQVAWKQISVMTKMACGARNAKASADALTFQVGSGHAHAWVKITLNASDYYDVELIKIKGSAKNPSAKVEVLEALTDIDCESLSEVVYHLVNK